MTHSLASAAKPGLSINHRVMSIGKMLETALETGRSAQEHRVGDTVSVQFGAREGDRFKLEVPVLILAKQVLPSQGDIGPVYLVQRVDDPSQVGRAYINNVDPAKPLTCRMFREISEEWSIIKIAQSLGF